MHKGKRLFVSLIAAGVLLFPTLASAKKISSIASKTV